MIRLAIIIGFWVLSHSASVFSQPNSSSSNSSMSSSSSRSIMSLEAKVEKLKFAYDDLGYSNPDKLAEIAVKYDLDKENLKSGSGSTSSQSSQSNSSASALWLDKMEVNGLRFYKKKDSDFPWQVKCSEYDKRVMHLCFESEYFQPSIKAFFDKGDDGDGRLDIFNDGTMNIGVDFASIYVPWRFGRSEYFDSWAWGPLMSIGISSANQGVNEETGEKTSGAPIVVTSIGLLARYREKQGSTTFGLEVGYAFGNSTDESYSDNSDRAAYVGLKVNIPLSSKPE